MTLPTAKVTGRATDIQDSGNLAKGQFLGTLAYGCLSVCASSPQPKGPNAPCLSSLMEERKQHVFKNCQMTACPVTGSHVPLGSPSRSRHHDLPILTCTAGGNIQLFSDSCTSFTSLTYKFKNTYTHPGEKLILI